VPYFAEKLFTLVFFNVVLGARMLLEKVVVIGKDLTTVDSVRTIAAQVFAADDVSDAWELIPSISPEFIILDPSVASDQLENFFALRSKKNINVPAAAVVQNASESSKQDLLSAGAIDVVGPDQLDRMPQLAQLAKNFNSQQIPSPKPCDEIDFIVGSSDSTRKTLDLIKLVAKSRCNPVLVIGESGTGKELAARAVHQLRHGRDSVFVGINCAALTASLLESELFGHVKGAFTGADRDKIGLLELAQDGTIFLDEISEMPLDLQAKLLRVLQEKTFRKVGGIKEIACRATIVASSNKNLFKESQSNKFRQDLYYRLAVCPITIAPLRSASRCVDITVLAQHFLQTSGICPEKCGKITGFTKLALEALQRHTWPGNIRELKNVIERAIILETTDKIGTSSLVFNPEQDPDQQSSSTAPVSDFSLERAEKELISRALLQSGYQKTRAASLLGITRATLYAKVKQYDIKLPESAIPVMADA
jgi:two-component system NtrC family response regulator